MSSTYNPLLVTLSVLIAMLASYAALDLASRVTVARGRARLIWLVVGSVAMGVGIWSMHFVAMLALSLPVAIVYDVPLLVLSVLVAIAASLLALLVVGREAKGLRGFLAAAPIMGSAIAGMHYIGLQSAACRTFRRDRHHRLVRRAVASVPLPRRFQAGSVVAQGGERRGDGPGHRRNALHSDGGRPTPRRVRNSGETPRPAHRYTRARHCGGHHERSDSRDGAVQFDDRPLGPNACGRSGK